MNLIQRQIFGNKAAVQAPNTFIGGVASTINTPALLATKLAIDVSRITNFSVVGSDIQCRITGSYEIPSSAFSNNLLITYYSDADGLAIDGGYNIFRETTQIKEISFDGFVIVTGQNIGYGSNINNFIFKNAVSLPANFFGNVGNNERKVFYIPKVTNLGGTVLNNNVFRRYGYGSFNSNSKIYCHPSLATNNSGGVDGDIAEAISLGCTIVYVLNQTSLNPITNLSIGTVYASAIQLNFTAPSSTNAIDYYECYANGVFKQNVVSGQFITGLSPNTSYNIEVKPVDIFYNKSNSNLATQITAPSSITGVESVRLRIEADGGFLSNEGIISDQYTNLVSNNLNGNLLFWHSYAGGIKKDGSNLVEKLYSFTNANTDVSQATVANRPTYAASGITFDLTDNLGKTLSPTLTNKSFTVLWRLKATPGDYYPQIGLPGWGSFLMHGASGGNLYAGLSVGSRFALGAGSFLTNTDATYTFTYNSVTKIAKIYRGTTLLGSKTMDDPIDFTSINVDAQNGTFYDSKMFNKELSLAEITAII